MSRIDRDGRYVPGDAHAIGFLRALLVAVAVLVVMAILLGNLMSERLLARLLGAS
jgi:hypothetical protein